MPVNAISGRETVLHRQLLRSCDVGWPTIPFYAREREVCPQAEVLEVYEIFAPTAISISKCTRILHQRTKILHHTVCRRILRSVDKQIITKDTHHLI